MTVRVFPVSPKSGPREFSARGKRCRASGFWYRDSHNDARRRFRHEAQDIFARTGSLVLAPEACIVLAVGSSPKGGHWARLWCPSSSRTYYLAHLHTPPVVVQGEELEAGQVVGLVGRTGNAARTCPHLHIRASLGRDRLTSRGWRRGRAVNIFRELSAVDPTRRGGSPRTSPETSNPASPPSSSSPCECEEEKPT